MLSFHGDIEEEAVMTYLQIIYQPFVLVVHLRKAVFYEVVKLRRKRDQMDRTDIDAVEMVIVATERFPISARHRESVDVVGKVA